MNLLYHSKCSQLTLSYFWMKRIFINYHLSRRPTAFGDRKVSTLWITIPCKMKNSWNSIDFVTFWISSVNQPQNFIFLSKSNTSTWSFLSLNYSFNFHSNFFIGLNVDKLPEGSKSIHDTFVVWVSLILVAFNCCLLIQSI